MGWSLRRCVEGPRSPYRHKGSRICLKQLVHRGEFWPEAVRGHAIVGQQGRAGETGGVGVNAPLPMDMPPSPPSRLRSALRREVFTGTSSPASSSTRDPWRLWASLRTSLAAFLGPTRGKDSKSPCSRAYLLTRTHRVAGGHQQRRWWLAPGAHWSPTGRRLVSPVPLPRGL